jgi:hypothetical protein
MKDWVTCQVESPERCCVLARRMKERGLDWEREAVDPNLISCPTAGNRAYFFLSLYACRFLKKI